MSISLFLIRNGELLLEQRRYSAYRIADGEINAYHESQKYLTYQDIKTWEGGKILAINTTTNLHRHENTTECRNDTVFPLLFSLLEAGLAATLEAVKVFKLKTVVSGEVVIYHPATRQLHIFEVSAGQIKYRLHDWEAEPAYVNDQKAVLASLTALSSGALSNASLFKLLCAGTDRTGAYSKLNLGTGEITHGHTANALAVAELKEKLVPPQDVPLYSTGNIVVTSLPGNATVAPSVPVATGKAYEPKVVEAPPPAAQATPVTTKPKAKPGRGQQDRLRTK